MQSPTRWSLVGLSVGLAFLWFAMRNANLDAAWQVLRDLHLGWTKAVFAGALLFMLIKSLRWAIVLRPVLRAPLGLISRTVYVGTAANLIVPHSGEVLRASLLARKESVAASAVLATIAIERMLDFVALVVLTAVALLIDPRVSPVLWSAGALSLAFVLLGLAVVTMLMRPRPIFRRWGQSALRLLPSRLRRWVAHQVTRGVAGLGSLSDPIAVLKLLALSVLQWACIVAAIWACARAVGITIPLSGAIAVFVLTVIGLTLPSSPAQLGTIQLAFVAGLELVDADPANAFAASVVYTLFVNVAMMVIGGICWFASDWVRPARPAAGSAPHA
ncbi:MAG TPA: lysylphosphatidylglycerol synthase transmembrane domain-containing protein [Burkholderiaceae bacterium]|jgi:hypothetical protein|nr:lysylphosphatidylglycerol synthase transmembrane domain-containing protein [Burkholderiaceae bacterium]